MRYEIKHPELLNISDETSGFIAYGGDQEWYLKFWNRKAGCGPTTAANITAYLALTNPQYRNLYLPQTLYKQDFSQHMDVLFNYVTPGFGGVNHINKFIDGLQRYSESLLLPYKIHSFSVDGKDTSMRDVLALREFVKQGLKQDSPLAFLNLSNGKESILQSWHWITITCVVIEDSKIIATASDEGELRVFDLQNWYMTTQMHGGLVYISAENL
jgi:hypothetical protein